ncbi:glycosyltransferase [Paenibacillus protaetiae]|uniref:Glycosyltransferase family 1 protein n=1 Tax=Paenibacillus protaetiae TaxID=2509456 RepID=A0A4P6EY85_9BACL|nr:glycosyltransferase [Paenibacillus protaetiae]QAY67213.1 glycosyltransferase family 1 protein [Paenibacillus protaetiae]
MAKVLHITEFTKGGVETHLNEVLQFQADKHDVYLMASELNSSRDALKISPERLVLYPYERKPLGMLRAMRAIGRKVKELQPDIIHVHGTFAGFFLRTLFFMRRQRPPVIYCSHGWAFLMDTKPWKKRIYAAAEKLLARRTDYIIHISDYEFQMATRYGLPSGKSVVVYNGVSDSPAAGAEPFEVPEGRINLLFIGRFDRQKGFELLLDVFRTNRFPNVHLYLVGDTVLKESAEPVQLPDQVTKIGWVNNAEIGRYVQACDAVVVPSRWEGFGIVAIEALRGGKPVIASRRGALPEIIQHGVNGYLFDFDQPEQLARLIRSLDKKELARMGEAGEQIFYRKFHSVKMNQQIERIYDRALRGEKESFAAAVKTYG